MAKQYDADSIQVLEGLEAVRKRPGMYVGGTDMKALHHLVYEIVDNSVDEALAGRCDRINVRLYADGSVSVEDNGVGIPVGINKKKGVSALELVHTVLHSGGKFDNDAYKVSGGLHGVGAAAVNALSEWAHVTVRRDGHLWEQKYNRGTPEYKVRKVRKMKRGEKTGTTTHFKPDYDQIFDDDLEFKYQTLVNRFREMAFVTSSIHLSVIDERKEGEHDGMTFYFEGGLGAYAQYLNRKRKTLHPPVVLSKDVPHPNVGNVGVDVAIQYTDGIATSFHSFANTINTPDGGVHLSGLREAVTRVINSYAKKNGFLKSNDDSFSQDDTHEGMTAIISIKHPDPQFESQTKVKLMNNEVRGLARTAVSETFSQFLEENPRHAKKIIERCLTSSRARAAAKRARELVHRKSALESLTLPGKLADCSEKIPEKCEIYIVEGDSAGGTAKQGRDRHFQAILPLRGKILNTERARLDKILQNNEVKSLISALGTGIGKSFELDKLRYGRVIIMTDADVDGSHIRTLLLTFFFRHMLDLVMSGHVYIAQPPLYMVKDGKKVHYTYTESEQADLMKSLGDKKVKLQRYKGLGEMNADQLWETTMDPDVRTLLQVTVDDVEEADSVFDQLMGNSAEKRREFITSNAKEVQNLDI